MPKYSIITIIAIMLWLKYTSFAQEKGNYFLRYYSPQEYAAHSQNWAAIEDDNGIIYIANGDGIIVLTGEKQKLFPLPSKTTVRSFAKDENGRIYLGSVGHFGYLAPDAKGEINFIDLSLDLPQSLKKFFDIWNILIVKDTVYFQSRTYIFTYNRKTKKTGIIASLSEHVNLFTINDIVYVKERSQGVYKIENDTLKSTHFTEGLEKYSFNNVCNQSSDTVLFASGNQLFQLTPNNNYKVIALNGNANKTLNELGIYRITASKMFIYVATSRSGMLVLDKNANLIKTIDETNGLNETGVYNLYIDSRNDLWVTMSNGFMHIYTSLAVSYWDKQNGLNSAVVDIVRNNNQIYLSTLAGFYTINKENKLLSLGSISGQTWSLKRFEVNNDSSKVILLASASSGLYEIDNRNNLTQILTGNTIFCLHQSKLNPNRLWLGLDKGLASIIYEKGKWQYEGEINEISDNIRAINEDTLGNLWIGTFRNGAIKLNFKDTTRKLLAQKYYTLENGFKSMKNILIYPYNNSLIFTSEQGLYIYNNLKDSIIEVEALGNKFYARDVFEFNEQSNKTIYLSGLYNLKSPITKGVKENNSYIWDENKLKCIPSMMVLSMFVENPNKVWIGGSEGLYFLNEENQIKAEKKFKVYISAVYVNNDSLLFNGFYADSGNNISIYQAEKRVYNNKNNTLSFEFGSNNYLFSNQTEYSYQLQGLENNWSNWSRNSIKQYTNLWEGKYIFKLRARDIYGHISEINSYSFTIEAPYYRTFVAYALYLLIFVAFIWMLIYFNSRRLIQQKRNLEAIVEKRTYELRVKNEEIILQNAELMQAKEEIQAQAEQLELTNLELEKLSLVVSETSNSVLIYNADLELEWVNKSFERTYGYSKNEFIQIHGKTILEQTSNASLLIQIQECINTNKSFNYESYNIVKNGKFIWIQVTITPILTANNQIKKIVAIETEISELKKAQAKINQQIEEIQSQNEQLMSAKEEIETQKNKIEDIHKNITGSINYAKTIQDALLPSKRMLNEHFENFILYRPKEIVSGDFYWTSTITYENDKRYCFLAVVDCTGHGVPGAFMSMIGMQLLNQIVNEQKIISPQDILNNLDAAIKKALKQNITENNDGMDMSIIRIEMNSDKLTPIVFAGAKRPIIWINNNNLEFVNGTRRSIGGAVSRNPHVFENKFLNVEKNDTIYLYSDGFIDQNGPNRKRYGTARFIEFIKNISGYSFADQQLELNTQLDKFMEGQAQRDDITIIAIKPF
jgi:PAS domain S-box-containing protein